MDNETWLKIERSIPLAKLLVAAIEKLRPLVRQRAPTPEQQKIVGRWVGSVRRTEDVEGSTLPRSNSVEARADIGSSGVSFVVAGLDQNGEAITHSRTVACTLSDVPGEGLVLFGMYCVRRFESNNTHLGAMRLVLEAGVLRGEYFSDAGTRGHLELRRPNLPE